jgi:transposase
MLTLRASVRVFVARGATDLRRSFDRLSAQVQEVLRQDPLPGHVFAFFNRQRNRVKLLLWERDGFWLLYKRLEAGTFAALDRDEINARELYLLLEGIEVVRERLGYTNRAIGCRIVGALWNGIVLVFCRKSGTPLNTIEANQPMPLTSMLSANSSTARCLLPASTTTDCVTTCYQFSISSAR